MPYNKGLRNLKKLIHWLVKIHNVTKSLKHKVILMTIYSAELRIGEEINFKNKDVVTQ